MVHDVDSDEDDDDREEDGDDEFNIDDLVGISKEDDEFDFVGDSNDDDDDVVEYKMSCCCIVVESVCIFCECGKSIGGQTRDDS